MCECARVCASVYHLRVCVCVCVCMCVCVGVCARAGKLCAQAQFSLPVRSVEKESDRTVSIKRKRNEIPKHAQECMFKRGGEGGRVHK